MANKTALITIQGISSRSSYLYDLVKDDPLFATKYQKIVDSPIDEVFSKKKPMWIKFFGKFGDSLDDLVDLLYHTEERIAACLMTRNIIRGLQLDGYTVELLCHSLGTLIALTCGPRTASSPIIVDTIYLMGCPMGIRNLPMRIKTNAYVERYGANFTTRKLHYLFSEEDKVSCRLKARTISILESRSMEDPLIHHTNTKHSALEYVQFLKENILSL